MRLGIESVKKMEPEDYSDDGSIVSVAHDFVEDIMEKQVDGSIVLLIVLVLIANPIFKTINTYLTRNKKD